MLVAVLEKRARVSLGQQDIFVNAAGGVKVIEPAVDLAVALAIASNVRNLPAGSDLVAIGELGLSGEVRRVNQLERRLLEAHRLGFKRAIIPAAAEIRAKELKGMELWRAETIVDAIRLCFGEGKAHAADRPAARASMEPPARS